MISLKERWESLFPGFYKWFLKNRKEKLEKSVIASACKGTKVSGFFYQNNIQSVHHIEKFSQCFKKCSIDEVTQTWETWLCDRKMTKSEQFMVLATICHRLNIQNLRLIVHSNMDRTSIDVMITLINFVNTNQHLANFPRNQRMSVANQTFKKETQLRNQTS